MEIPSQKHQSTSANGRNVLYRPLCVPPHRSGTCKAAVAALAEARRTSTLLDHRKDDMYRFFMQLQQTPLLLLLRRIDLKGLL
jgi:hypothetical protein